MKKLLLASAAVAALAFPAHAQTGGSSGGTAGGSGTIESGASSSGGAGGSSMDSGSTGAASGGMPGGAGASQRGAGASSGSGMSAGSEGGAGASGRSAQQSDEAGRVNDAARDERTRDENRNQANTGRDGERNKDNASRDGKEGKDGMKSGRASAPREITTEKRTEIRQKISTTNVQRVNVDFNVSVGVAVPRTVSLLPVPASIISIVPEYEGYNYIVLADGRILIIEPSSYEVVTIIAG
jgi:hypothetical protein